MPETDFSPTFVKAINAMIHHKKPGEVGLLMRWDNNDSMFWTIWSESYSNAPVTPPYRRRPADRLEKLKNGQIRSCTPCVLGGHAEEIMIRSWDGYREEVEKQDDPFVVDLFLTDSPCLDASNAYADDFGLWPKGCAPKLAKFIKGCGDRIQWNISYLDYYGKFSTRPKAIAAVQILEKLDNVTIYKIFK
ncbi:hypothetical protein [Pseudomonas sp. TE3610]